MSDKEISLKLTISADQTVVTLVLICEEPMEVGDIRDALEQYTEAVRLQ